MMESNILSLFKIKHVERIEHSNLKSYDDNKDLEECVDDAESNHGTHFDFLDRQSR